MANARSLSDLSFAQPLTPLELSGSEGSAQKKSRKSPPLFGGVTNQIWRNGILAFCDFKTLGAFFCTSVAARNLSKDPRTFKMICDQQGIEGHDDDLKERIRYFHKLILVLNHKKDCFTSPFTRSVEGHSRFLCFESMNHEMLTVEQNGELNLWPEAPRGKKTVKTLPNAVEKTLVCGKRVIFAYGRVIECWNFSSKHSYEEPELALKIKEGDVVAMAVKYPTLAVTTPNELAVFDLKEKKQGKRWKDIHFFFLKFVDGGLITLSNNGNFRFICLQENKQKYGKQIPNLTRAIPVKMFGDKLCLGFAKGVEIWQWNGKEITLFKSLPPSKQPIVDITNCSHQIFATLDAAGRIAIWHMNHLEKPIRELRHESMGAMPMSLRFNLKNRMIISLHQKGNEYVMVTTFYNTPSSDQGLFSSP